jgi:mRNA interferase RelE/StbE
MNKIATSKIKTIHWGSNKQFKKLQNSPQLGIDLGNKAGYNLSGCKKLYVDKKKIRIVYRIVDNEILV